MKKPHKKVVHFQFHIVKWDETGNILLEKLEMTVQRHSLSTARTVVSRKYPASKGYFQELNNIFVK
jgi:hypothetical protein